MADELGALLRELATRSVGGYVQMKRAGPKWRVTVHVIRGAETAPLRYHGRTLAQAMAETARVLEELGMYPRGEALE